MSADPTAVVPASGEERMGYIDALRGLAAISVVFFHYTLLHDARNFGLFGEKAIHVVNYYCNLGKAGVVLFFAISGFVIPNSLRAGIDRPAERFLIGRFFRLYPLYWFSILLCIVARDTQNGPDFYALTANLTMVQGFLGFKDINEASWTLEIELVFYALCLGLFLVGSLRSSLTQFRMFLAMLIFALLLAGIRYVLLRKMPVALPLGICVMYLGSLWRSAIIARDDAARTYARWAICSLALGLPPLCALAYAPDFGFNEPPLSYIIAYAGGVAVFLLGTTLVKLGAVWLVHLGTISYSIYLLHTPLMLIYMKLDLVPPVDGGPLLWWTWLLLAILSVVAVSHVSYLCVEKPFIALGRHLFARRLEWSSLRRGTAS